MFGLGLKLMRAFVAPAALVALLACGKAPVAPPTAARGAVVGILKIAPGLAASRLLSAGCVQVVQTPDGKRDAEFSSLPCPSPASELLPLENVAFAVSVSGEPSIGSLALSKDGVPVGYAMGLEPEGEDGLPAWKLEHLCQISDPSVEPQPHLAEICLVQFETEDGAKQGRYRSLRITPLEELARKKIAETDAMVKKEVSVLQRLSGLERDQEMIRREVNRARSERQEAREALAEAQRGVRDSIASNLTVHRLLERKKMEAELGYAQKDAAYYELSIRAVNKEKERAAMLKTRIEESDRAKSREETIQKKIDFYAQRGETDESKLVQTLFDQNHALILSAEERRKLEEFLTFANAEAERLKELTEAKSTALKLIIEKGDELEKLDRQPPPSKPPGATED